MTATRKQRKLSASQEDYLEAVLALVATRQVARVRDIAKRLGVSMSSVSSALRLLAKRKLVNYDPYEAVTLTRQGTRLAEQIRQRHRTLCSFLTDVLCINRDVAEANACRMEHAVDDVVLARLDKLDEFLKRNKAADRWCENFLAFCEKTARSQENR